jgi:predicted RNase H-like HicB family nuclease
MKTVAKTVEEYLRLPYTIQLRQYEDGTFFAEVAELPGCMTEADTAEEAVEMIRDAMAGWIEVALSEGLPIPSRSTVVASWCGPPGVCTAILFGGREPNGPA